MGEQHGDTPPPRTTPSAPPLTDSPWFWLCLFGCAALIGLVVVAPKYAKRGQRLEWQHQGREHAFRERAVATTPTSDRSDDGESQTLKPRAAAVDPPAPASVWPLIAAIGGVLLLGGAAVFTLRMWRTDQSQPADAPPARGA
jgi:hypothetical protein